MIYGGFNYFMGTEPKYPNLSDFSSTWKSPTQETSNAEKALMRYIHVDEVMYQDQDW